MYQFRKFINNKEHVFAQVKQPALLVLIESETCLLYGDFNDLVPLMKNYSQNDSVAVILLPESQDTIDTIFSSDWSTRLFIRNWKRLQYL